MNSMYSAEQIAIPQELGAILKQYTKAVIRERPENLYAFSANFFSSLSGQVPPFDERGQLVSQGNAGGSRGPSGGDMVGDVIPGGGGGFESVDGGDDMGGAIEGLLAQYDADGTGQISKNDLPALVSDLREMLGLQDEERPELTVGTITDMFEVDGDGAYDLEELKGLLFQ